jgi:hypothetical protein
MRKISPKLLKTLLPVFVFAIAAFAGRSSASAQTGVYATFTAAKTGVPNTSWIYGPTVGAYFDSSHLAVLEWGVDLRGSFLGGNGTHQLQSGLVGPRVAAHLPIIPLKPYVEGLVGIGHLEAGQGSAQLSATKFEYQVVGGVELNVLPRLDWRVIEASYGGLPGIANGINPTTLSTGLVFRVPFL